MAFQKHPRDVILHRLFRQEHFGGDFPIGEAQRNEVEDDSLLFGEGRQAFGNAIRAIFQGRKYAVRQSDTIGRQSHDAYIPIEFKSHTDNSPSRSTPNTAGAQHTNMFDFRASRGMIPCAIPAREPTIDRALGKDEIRVMTNLVVFFVVFGINLLPAFGPPLERLLCT